DGSLCEVFVSVSITCPGKESYQGVVIFKAAHSRSWKLGVINGTSSAKIPVKEAVCGKTVVVNIKPLEGEILIAIATHKVQIMVIIEGGFIIDSRFKGVVPVNTVFL